MSTTSALGPLYTFTDWYPILFTALIGFIVLGVLLLLLNRESSKKNCMKCGRRFRPEMLGLVFCRDCRYKDLIIVKPEVKHENV